MKAVILAGGKGTRLESISGGLPKPMMPLLGKPMLEHILLLLRSCGFDRVCITLAYRPECIADYFGDGRKWGLSLSYRREQQPLGTAGSVKGCMDFIGSEPFLVMAGDCLCDFALNEIAAQHRGAATIVLSRAEEPLEYGLVVADDRGRVAGFLEKPEWEHVVTDCVSTGIYMLDPRVMELVPEGQPFDFARDLFPLLLRRGIPMQAVSPPGYWCDIGTPRSYYKANLDLLDGLCRPADSGDMRRLVIPCRSRAALMGKLAAAACRFGADWSDGLRLSDGKSSARAAPLSDRSAIIIEGCGEPCLALEILARRIAGAQ